MLEVKQFSKMATASGKNLIFSDYCLSLNDVSKLCYLEKIRLCGFDPYGLKKSEYSDDFTLLPKIEYPDIVNYLVIQASWATNKEMKAYKSTEAYNFFVSGWVNSLLVRKVGDDKVVVYSRVCQTFTL